MALCTTSHLLEALQLLMPSLVVCQQADSSLSVQQHPIPKGQPAMSIPWMRSLPPGNLHTTAPASPLGGRRHRSRRTDPQVHSP